MKDSIITLIEDNIVNVKLIEGLAKLGIDASAYYFNTPSVVFKLVGIEDSKEIEEIYKIYFEWLKNGETIDISESRSELRKYAEQVYLDLFSFYSKK